MKNLKSRAKKLYLSTLSAYISFQPIIANAQADEVQGRIESALSQVQTVLTSLIVIVGIVVALFIILKRMPSADDPQEKNEVYKAVGRVLALVAIGASIVWVVPWVYSLFT